MFRDCSQALTPSQFVYSLLSNKSLQDQVHFSQYYLNCDYCGDQVSLDAILKMETWDEDMTFISNALQIKVLTRTFSYTDGFIIEIMCVTCLCICQNDLGGRAVY